MQPHRGLRARDALPSCDAATCATSSPTCSSVDPDEFADQLYTYHDDAAVAHLFGVAAGLDSMIIGEGEILGQVREAWLAAEQEHASGPRLSRVFRQAIEVGKRARTETAIGRHPVSISSAAVTLAPEHGSARSTGGACSSSGPVRWVRAWPSPCRAPVSLEIVVANRTLARGQALAERVGGRAIPLEAVPDTLVECDVLLVSTAAATSSSSGARSRS